MSDTDPELRALFALPELTLSLRRFGSSRRTPSSSSAAIGASEAAAAGAAAATRAAHERFFNPLLAARRTAEEARERAAVVAAFDVRRLAALLDAAIRGFAAERFANDAPARRALEAELGDIVEPYRVSLGRLRTLAESAAAAVPDDEQPWRAWVEQLRAVFRIADAVWTPLCDTLETTAPSTAGRPRRLPGFGSRGKSR